MVVPFITVWPVPVENDFVPDINTFPLKTTLPVPLDMVVAPDCKIFPAKVVLLLNVGSEFTIKVLVLSTPKTVFVFTLNELFTDKLFTDVDILLYYIGGNFALTPFSVSSLVFLVKKL
jgi:hypothetical protein